MLYTVVLDYRGGTYISQVNAGSVAGALKIWADALDIGAVARLGPQRKGELIDDIKMQLSSGQPPAPLDGLVNAWCASALNGAIVRYLRPQVRRPAISKSQIRRRSTFSRAAAFGFALRAKGHNEAADSTNSPHWY
jgi:hypothetical protein